MKHKEKVRVISVLLVVFFSIFILNNKTLYISDDFLYKFEFNPGMPDHYLEPVDGLFSLLKSQYHHYSLWNGRFVAHTIIQIFMQFDKWIFNIFNTGVYLLLGLLILKIGMKVTHNKMNVMALITVYALLFLSVPSFGQTVLWISGAVNYLWMSIIYLSFYFYNINAKNDTWQTVLVSIIIGFFAGATNENTGPATILMVILMGIYYFYKEKKIRIWRISGIISAIIGFSMILFAPAATKRVAERNEVSLATSVISKNLNSITQYIIDNYLIYFLIIVLLLIILYKNNRINEKIIINVSILFIGFLAATYSLVAVDKIIGRTMFGPVLFLITITIILLLEFFEFVGNQKVLLSSLIPLMLIVTYVYNQAFLDINQTYKQVDEQYEIILNNPEEDVRVPMITDPNTDYNAYNNGTNYLKENNDAWLNKWAARFFDVRSIGGY